MPSQGISSADAQFDFTKGLLETIGIQNCANLFKNAALLYYKKILILILLADIS